MCDTILALPRNSTEQSMLFGKNSDRQRNEAQAVEHLAAAEYGPEVRLQCTYISIPQVRRTNAVLLSRPFWIWGAEMGANEHGVVIGNEGLAARDPAPQEKALIGMDLVRLALERASTAAQAVELIIELLEQHGQGGNCGHLIPSYYNNGFMIADAREAFVLETLGREWLLERVRDVRSISNRYSIARDVARSSGGLRTLIRDRGWSAETEFDFCEVLSDPAREHIGHATARRACTTSLLAARSRRVSVADMMRILRDHGAGDGYHSQWRAECTSQRTVCMHAGAEDRPGQTVGSMVSELRQAQAVHWVTATSAPCISVFKPVLLEVPLPSRGPTPTDRFDADALWWRHERLHRAALRGDFGAFIEAIRSERDRLEEDFRVRISSALQMDVAERARVVAECWTDAAALEEGWLLCPELDERSQDSASAAAWAKLSNLSALNDD